MDEDFDELYDDDQEESLGDITKDIIENINDTRKNIKNWRDSKDSNSQQDSSTPDSDNPSDLESNNTQDNFGNNSDINASNAEDARNFDHSLRDKSNSRAQSPDASNMTNGAGASQAGNAVATETGSAATAGGTAAAETGGAVAAEAGGAVAAEAGGAVAAEAAGSTAAAAGGAAAGAAAGVALPVIGWVIALILPLLNNLKKKSDERMAENGVDAKGLRRLILASPFLIIGAILILLLIILAQAETQDRVGFLEQGVVCLETGEGCDDFMNTGVKIASKEKPLMKYTDLELADFVVRYVVAENRYFGNNSTFISDMVDDIKEASTVGLDDPSMKEKVEKKFNELVDNTFIGDIKYAWNLFNWLRLEKKVFNNIQWHRVYTRARLSFASEAALWLEAGFTHQLGLDKDFNLDWVTEERVLVPVDEMWLDGDSWLAVPVTGDEQKLTDQAITAVEPYLPTWLEIYATYMATGDYKIANDMYNYYCTEYAPEMTLYQLAKVSIKTVEERTSKREESYELVVNDKVEEVLTKKQYENYIENSSRTFLTWLADLWDTLTDRVKEAYNSVVRRLKKYLGFHISVEAEYIPVVTKGLGFENKVVNEYNVIDNHTAEDLPDESDQYTQSSRTVSYTDPDTRKRELAKIKVRMVFHYKCSLDTYFNYITLDQSESKIEEYEYNNRYEEIFMKMVDKYDYNYTIDDVAIADEVIIQQYSTGYGLTTDFVPFLTASGGDYGLAISKFAEQFLSYNLRSMMAVDDTGTFWGGHWCAMFVSYCMKKAQIPVQSYSSCSAFWSTNKNQPGFYDLATFTYTKYKNPDPNHIKTIADMEPGDIVLFRYSNEDSAYARSHTSLVYSIEKDENGNVTSLITIDGNIGGNCPWGSKVDYRERINNIGIIASFVDISEVLEQAKNGNVWTTADIESPYTK